MSRSADLERHAPERVHADSRYRQARAEAALPGGAALPALRVRGDRGQHPLPRRSARHHFDPGVLGLLAARGPPGRVLRPRGPETGHPRQRRLPRARSRRPPEALPGGREPPGPQAAHGADQLRGRLPAARHGAARPRRHRADGPGPGPGRRRDRHAAQGGLPARRAGGGAADLGPADRLDRRTGRRGPRRAALQHRVPDRPGTRANPSSRASAAR